MRRCRLKIGLQGTLLILFAVVFVVPFFIFVNLVFNNTATLLEEKAVLYESEVTSNALKQIDNLFMSLEKELRALNNETFNKIICKGPDDFASAQEYKEQKVVIETMLDEVCAIRPEAESVYIYTKHNMKYCKSPFFEIDDSYSAQNMEWFKSLTYIVGSRPRLLARQPDMQIKSPEHQVIPFVSPINQSPTGTIEAGNVGVVQFNIAPSYIDSFYNVYIEAGKKLMVFSNDQHIVYSSTDDIPQRQMVSDYWSTIRRNVSGSIVSKWQGEPLMLSYRTSGYSNVTFVVITEELDHIQEIRGFRINMFVFIAFFVIAFFIIAHIIARSISAPIKRLDSIITKVQQGRIEDEITIEHYGSSGLLKDHMKNLAGTINGLLAKIQGQHNRERQQEIRILEAQINPHFIYNTLDAIRWMAVMRREPEIAEMVKSLIRLLKSSIQIGKDTITIREEIAQIKDYTVLQQLRYVDSFTVEYHIDNEMYPCKTLKFVLQPIVENAIFHGIDHDAKDGVIIIDIHRDGDRIVYHVSDNGRGLSEDESPDSLKRKSHGNWRGIGLNNVNRRIKEYFGEEYGLEMKSIPGEGMTVIITIPCICADAEQGVDGESDEHTDC